MGSVPVRRLTAAVLWQGVRDSVGEKETGCNALLCHSAFSVALKRIEPSRRQLQADRVQLVELLSWKGLLYSGECPDTGLHRLGLQDLSVHGSLTCWAEWPWIKAV